jgi:hypothetical protein
MCQLEPEMLEESDEESDEEPDEEPVEEPDEPVVVTNELSPIATAVIVVEMWQDLVSIARRAAIIANVRACNAHLNFYSTYIAKLRAKLVRSVATGGRLVETVGTNKEPSSYKIAQKHSRIAIAEAHLAKSCEETALAHLAHALARKHLYEHDILVEEARVAPASSEQARHLAMTISNRNALDAHVVVCTRLAKRADEREVVVREHTNAIKSENQLPRLNQ